MGRQKCWEPCFLAQTVSSHLYLLLANQPDVLHQHWAWQLDPVPALAPVSVLLWTNASSRALFSQHQCGGPESHSSVCPGKSQPPSRGRPGWLMTARYPPKAAPEPAVSIQGGSRPRPSLRHLRGRCTSPHRCLTFLGV